MEVLESNKISEYAQISEKRKAELIIWYNYVVSKTPETIQSIEIINYELIEIADGYCVEKFVLVTNVKDIINNQINTKNQEMFVFRPYTLETEKIVSDSYHSIFRTYEYLHREINRKEKPSEIFSPIFIEFNSFKTFYKHEDFRKHFVNEAPKITKILKKL